MEGLEAASGSPWSSVLNGLLAATVPVVMLQILAWWRANKRRHRQHSEEDSAVQIARINADSNANERVIALLTAQVAQRDVDCAQLEKERENLQQRNTELSRKYALADANLRILITAMKSAGAPIPLLITINGDGSVGGVETIEPPSPLLLPPKKKDDV